MQISPPFDYSNKPYYRLWAELTFLCDPGSGHVHKHRRERHKNDSPAGVKCRADLFQLISQQIYMVQGFDRAQASCLH